MINLAPDEIETDLDRLLHGAALVMSELSSIAAAIETEVLKGLASRSADPEPDAGIQKIDLLLQSLDEMQRLLARAPHKLRTADGFDALVGDIRLEHLRAHFESTSPPESRKQARARSSAITVFD